MLLNKIQSGIQAYNNWLATVKHHPYVYKWESVQHFQLHWNTDTPDPAAMFDQSFFNSETRRMWQRENWEPKRVMSQFWKFDALTVKMMFDDLFNETRPVDGRIGRFLFGCDALLQDYKKAKPLTVENNHYHGDYQMIALYLAFRYPESYAPYDFPVFQKAMEFLGAREVPQQNDLPRYFKVLNTLMTFLEKDPHVKKNLEKHLASARYFQGKAMLLAEDFCRFIGQ